MQRSGLELKRFSCPILLHTTHDFNWDHESYLDGGRALQAEFPNLRIIENGQPDAVPTFTHLWNSPTVLPPNINVATAELLSYIPAFVKARQDTASLEREVEALRNSNSYRITYPLRLAATLARDAYAKLLAAKRSNHEIRNSK